MRCIQSSQVQPSADPGLSESVRYVRELYQVPGVAETVDLGQIKRHYYVSQRTINPTQNCAGGARAGIRSTPRGVNHLG